MTIPRRSLVAKREAYRRVILDCAEELLAQEGDARIGTIAQSAGVAPRTLYSVFASKQEIVDAVRERRRVAMVAQARADAVDATSALDALTRSVRSSNRFFLEHPDYLRMELRDSRAWSDEGPSDTWHQAFRAYARLFERAMRDGTVHDGDAEACARALLAVQQSQLAHWVARGMPADHEQVLDGIELLMHRAFTTDRTE